MIVVNIVAEGCEMDLEFGSRALAIQAENELRVWTVKQGLIVTISRWWNSVIVVFSKVTDVLMTVAHYHWEDRMDYY